ncbi:PP2C family protein-serine/threonine phosphatase [Streptomyces sp. DSM 44915]|uniref:PP2C family protein-serine/threonine phosphatase n=1 Tax=Streptomyces chisholmiae TaxID=3075540 RepID=A0ABU2JYQ3_9ACTN|nr:PP2C family protein-serine/threonine phosphatase [Streptomyces sp. DSM 44915]MDT0270135.1 PP2C family protein-serine/threonine phosphatase [Streptomyces sp. DSM 44915]
MSLPAPYEGLRALLPRQFWVVPWVLLAALALVQAVVPGWVQLGFAFAALPPLTGLLYGPWRTGALAAAVLALMIFPLTSPHHITTPDVAAIGAIAVFSVLVAWVRNRYTRQLVRVGDVAEAAQHAVMPPVADRVGGVRCAGLYRAAQVAALVGGDLFDVREGPFGVRALVADVQGHGLAAVGTVAALLGTFREALLDEPELSGVATRLDRRLRIDAGGDEGEPSEVFATAVLLEFPPDLSSVRLASCGHPPVLLLRDGRVRELAAEPAPPLGLGLGPVVPRPVTVPLRAGDLLLGYTDGVTEARDAGGAFYPLAERLAARCGAPARQPLDPESLVRFVWADVTGFARAVEDDVALLALCPILEAAGPHRL